MKKFPTVWKNLAEPVVIFSLLLVILGSVNIFSASFVMAAMQFGDGYFFIKKHLISFVLGALLMYFAVRFNYQRLKDAVPFLLVTVISLLVAVHINGIGLLVNGAQRWIKIGSFLFQPSELAKPIIVIIIAVYLSECIKFKRKISLASWPVFCVGAIAGLIQTQPDMSTAFIIVLSCLILYLVAGIPKQEIIFIGVMGALSVVALIYIATYRAVRILAWIDPWSYEQSIGYQTVQSLLSIGSGGFWGQGIGRGTSKFFYLPEAHTDFAFAVWCQETGMIGVLLLLSILMAFAYYVLQVALRTSDNFGRFIVVGVLFFIVGQAIINMAMVTGLLPVMGVPFPFLSYGGSSLIVNMFAVGLVASVARKIPAEIIVERILPEIHEQRSYIDRKTGNFKGSNVVDIMSLSEKRRSMGIRRRR